MSGKKQEDEISFLLSNVNDSSNQIKKPLVTSDTKKKEEESNNHTLPTDEDQIQNEDDDSSNQMWSWDWTTKTEHGPMMFYMIMGLVVTVIVGSLVIIMGVFVSATVTIFLWFFGWFAVCCGGFYCISKRPKAVHLCNGLTIGLVFGMFSMVSFSMVADIVSKPVYGPVNVSSIPDFDVNDGDIVYFLNGAPQTIYLGQSSINEDDTCVGSTCERMFFCVAPMIDATNFSLNSTAVDYWVGCQVPEFSANCQSPSFLASECYQNWGAGYNSGYTFGTEGRVAQAFLDAVVNSVVSFGITVSGGPVGNFSNWHPNSGSSLRVIVVMLSPDPEEEAGVFWTVGWLLVAVAPMVYCICGLLYSLMCKHRFQREKYEEVS